MHNSKLKNFTLAEITSMIISGHITELNCDDGLLLEHLINQEDNELANELKESQSDISRLEDENADLEHELAVAKRTIQELNKKIMDNAENFI